jgi:hypothetical protein
MTDRIELHQPTRSECLPRHEQVSPRGVRTSPMRQEPLIPPATPPLKSSVSSRSVDDPWCNEVGPTQGGYLQ